mmetsp:Transcript_50580/g.145836  ORF Transcript_50580/g.145836 Transcript_50580/m.145836 type:complete len:305 (-) Transcript_50580:2-916(-)
MLRAAPWVVLGAHGEKDNAERKVVSQEGVHFAVGMRFWRAVHNLSSRLALHFAPQGRRPEVDELRVQGRIKPRQQDILQGEVAVGDPQIVQPTHRRANLSDDWPHLCFPLTSGCGHGLVHAPIEQIALATIARRHQGLVNAAEDTVQAASVGVPMRSEQPHNGNVKPRLLCRLRVEIVEVPGAMLYPSGGHSLHRQELAAVGSILHKLHLAMVRLGLLQIANVHQARSTAPWLYLHARGKQGVIQISLRNRLRHLDPTECALPARPQPEAPPHRLHRRTPSGCAGCLATDNFAVRTREEVTKSL